MGERAWIDIDEIFPTQLDPACERDMGGGQGKGTGESWSSYFYPSFSQCLRSRGHARDKGCMSAGGCSPKHFLQAGLM